MTTETKKALPRHIFLSYASGDRQIARKLRASLSRWTHAQVFTPEDLDIGDRVDMRLRNELSRSDVFVILLSPASVSSPWVLHELGAAWALKKPIAAVTTTANEPKVPVNVDSWISMEEIDDPEAMKRWLLAA
jgi:nucleoside 2-deoxyribosyltransferase